MNLLISKKLLNQHLKLNPKNNQQKFCQIDLNDLSGRILLFISYYAFGSLNELFRDTIRLNTGDPSLESWISAQKNPVLTNWKLS